MVVRMVRPGFAGRSVQIGEASAGPRRGNTAHGIASPALGRTHGVLLPGAGGRRSVTWNEEGAAAGGCEAAGSVEYSKGVGTHARLPCRAIEGDLESHANALNEIFDKFQKCIEKHGDGSKECADLVAQYATENASLADAQAQYKAKGCRCELHPTPDCFVV
jgi:hypothetical protein